MMYVIKQRGQDTYYTVKCDSYGYTVDFVTQDIHGATKFETKEAARDVLSELDEYWAEQATIRTV